MIFFSDLWLSNFNIRFHLLLSDQLRKVNEVRREDVVLGHLSFWYFGEFFLDVHGEVGESWQEYIGFHILEESNVLLELVKWDIVVVADLFHLLHEVEGEGLALLGILHLPKFIGNFALLLEDITDGRHLRFISTSEI